VLAAIVGLADALLRVFERDPAEFGAQPRHATV
jgi:hypothetical protein